MKNMMLSSNAGEAAAAPKAATLQALAAGGACEAYPLAPANDANGGRAVRARAVGRSARNEGETTPTRVAAWVACRVESVRSACVCARFVRGARVGRHDDGG